MGWLGYADCANSGNDELALTSSNTQSNALRLEVPNVLFIFSLRFFVSHMKHSFFNLSTPE